MIMIIKKCLSLLKANTFEPSVPLHNPMAQGPYCNQDLHDDEMLAIANGFLEHDIVNSLH